MIKRIYFSILLATSGSFIIHPVFAEGDEPEEEITIVDSSELGGNSCGATCAWSLDSTGKLTVWGTNEDGTGSINIGGAWNASPWFKRTDVVTVEVKKGITEIPKSTFSWISSLENVSLPDDVTSIGVEAFLRTNLTSFTFPEGITIIPTGAFSNAGLKNVVIPNSVTEIGASAFAKDYYGNPLESLTLGKNLKTIGAEAFVHCNNLKTLDIPDSVETIGDTAFYNARALTSLTLGQNLKTIGAQAFSSCGVLTDLIIPDSVETIGSYAFSGAQKLTSLTLGGSLKTIGASAFEGVIRLTSLDIPDSVETIGNKAFYNVQNLTDLTLGKNLKTIGEQAFYGASKLKELIIPESVTSIAANAFQNSGIEKLYCKIGEQADMCRTAVPNAEVFEYTFKDGYYYDKDGKCYASLQNLSIGKDIKRIYTVEEAAAVTKPTGNTFKIRYR